MKEQLALLPGYLTAHLQLTLFALLAGAAVSIPAGIAITRSRRLERPVLAVASVIQTVPSLALLAVMVPALSSLGLRSIGFLPAFIGLTLVQRAAGVAEHGNRTRRSRSRAHGSGARSRHDVAAAVVAS